MPEGVSEDIEFVKSLRGLNLDPKNPRLPPAAAKWSQDKLLAYIEKHHEPILIGRSISRFGFFVSEPIIVIREDRKQIVVEGNRRLAALKLLTSATARKLVANREWDSLGKNFSLPGAGVPIVRASSRDAVAPIIGYRHIAGIQDWDPYPKSRFITSFVDEDELSFSRVAELVGETETNVRRLYRNYGVIQQAKDFGIDTSRAEADFGVFDRALVGGIREYIEAPPPSWLSERTWPLPETNKTKTHLKQVLSWIYGDTRRDPVASDSRALSTLSSVLRSPEGVATLRKTRDLDAAEEASGGPKARLLERLGSASENLRGARQDLPEYRADQSVGRLVRSCKSLADALVEELDA